MSRAHLVAGVCLCVASLPLPPVGAEHVKTFRIELGGPRQVVADLAVSSAEYRLAVRMAPVRCFDPPTNEELNREKARLLGLQALAQHLSPKRDVQLVVVGAQVESAGLRGKLYVLNLRVPRSGVTLEEPGDKPGPPPKPEADRGIERVRSASALLTRKQDHLDTLQRLLAEWHRGLQAAERLPPTKEDRAYLRAVADLEDQGQSRLAVLAGEVERDVLLLQVEKEELLHAIAREKQSMLAALKDALKKREAALPGEGPP